ncbi:hypothetical protein LUZ60_017234 [Juncus effusus]|nr:hypothetical protein LUZ60_017234 [Juncus effusus]
MGEEKVTKIEGVLRIICMVLCGMSALLMGLNAQTKTVFFVERKATVKDIQALWIVTVATAAVAGYQFLQILKCFYLSFLAENPCSCKKGNAWFCFLLDQAATYATFATTLAALQGSMVALKGINSLQWTKLCNIYTRFCDQVAGSLLCGAIASFVMVIITSISAYHLFKLYPSKSRPSHRSWALF